MSYDQTKDILSLYIDSSKNYIQLATGLLAATIVFSEKIVQSDPLERSGLLIASWISLFSAVGLGSIYPYLAIKMLDERTASPGGFAVPSVFTPGQAYGLMIIFFYIGAGFFVAHAIRAARGRIHKKA